MSIFVFAESSKYREEILKVLFEQLFEASEFCVTGKFARLISVIQGFTNDEKLSFRIKDSKRFATSHLMNYINEKIQESEDEIIMDGLVNSNPHYVKFIKNCAENWMKLNQFELTRKDVTKIIEEKYNARDLC